MAYGQAGPVAYHEKLAGDWEGRYQKRSFQARIAALEECLSGRDLAGSEWLDAGCGTGTLTRLLAEKGCAVTGMDAAPGMIEIARQEALQHASSARIRFEVAETIERLPHAAASLDGVLCSSVLEYVSSVEDCLAGFARVLKPSGVLLVSVPNAQSIVRRAQVATYYWGRQLGRPWLDFIEYSRNEYSAEEFAALLRAHGFEVQKTVVFGSPLPRWIQRKRFGGSLLMFVAIRQ